MILKSLELGNFLDELRLEPFDSEHNDLPRGSVGLLNEGVVTLFGIKTTMDEAMFTDEETAGTERRTAKIRWAGKNRYLAHARKMKGIIRRAHREGAKEIENDFNWVGEDCVFPNEPCTKCVDCYDYGALLPSENLQENSRVRMHDLISVQPFDRKISFRARHPHQEDEDPTPFQEVVVPPGTNFIYAVRIMVPTISTLAGFLWANELADKHGYGNYTSVRGECKTDWLCISDGLPSLNKLDAIKAVESEKDPVSNVKEYIEEEMEDYGKDFIGPDGASGTVDELVEWFDELTGE